MKVQPGGLGEGGALQGCPWQAEDGGGWGWDQGKKRLGQDAMEATTKARRRTVGKKCRLRVGAGLFLGAVSRVGSQTRNPANPELSVSWSPSQMLEEFL